MKSISDRIGNPAVTVAVVGLIGVVFAGFAAFAGVVAAPLLQAFLKTWGWL